MISINTVFLITFFVLSSANQNGTRIKEFHPQTQTQNDTIEVLIGTGRSYQVVLNKIEEPYNITVNSTQGISISSHVFQIDNSFEVSFNNDKPHFLFTDFYYFSALNRALLIRNDLMLFEMSFSFKDEQGEFLFRDQNVYMNSYEKNLVTLFSGLNSNEHPQILVDGEIVLILCDRGGLLLSIKVEIISLKRQSSMKMASFDLLHKNVVIMYQDSIDIYTYDQKSLTFLKTLSGISPIDFCYAIDSISSNQYFHVLDVNVGVLTFTTPDYEQTSLTIPLPQSIAFDCLNNTLIIITQTKSKDQILAELFLFYDTSSFFINKFEFLNIECFDIKMLPQYTLIVGYNAHKIIMHGIYREFKQDFGQFAFYQHSMFKAIVEQLEGKKDKFIIYGMAQQQFKILEIQWNQPQVQIQLQQDGIENYQLQVYTKTCHSIHGQVTQQNHTNLESVYGRCKNIIDLKVEAETILYESKNGWLIYTILILVGCVIIGGFSCCIYKCRLWKRQNEELQLKFNSLNEVPEKKMEEDEKGLKINELQ